MNQLDWEKMKEDMRITNVERVNRSSWFVAQNEYVVNTGSLTSGTYTDTRTVNDQYERFMEASTVVSYNPSGYTVGGSTSWVSGSVSDLTSNNGVYMTFRSYSTGTDTSYNPSGYNLVGGTTLVSGAVSDLASNDGSYMTFRSYASAYAYVQVTYVSAGTGSGTTGNPTPAYPAGLQANDLVLLQVTVRDTTTTPTTPTGFTLLYGSDSTGTGRQWVYYKFSDGTESGTITITIGSTVCKAARLYAFRNVATSSFIEGGGFGTGTGATISAQSVTTTDVQRLAVSFVFVNDNNVVASFTGETGGDWTEAVAEFRTSAGSDGCLQLQTATMASAGTISGGSYTMSAADPWGVRAFALIPNQAPSEYTCEVEFTGTSNTDVWSQLAWTVDSAWDTNSVTVTLQLYNWTSLSYPTSGDGCITYTSSATPNTDETQTQTIITDSMHFRDGSGNWKIKIKGSKSTSTQFEFKADWVEYKPTRVEYISEVEFTGTSNTGTWTQLVWTVDSCWTTANVNVTLQLYNYNSGSYPTSGDGYLSYTSSATPNTDETQTQTITTDSIYFRDGSGNWAIKIKGTKATTTQFDFKADWIEFKTNTADYYALDIAGTFAIDISTYPLAYAQTIEIQMRYRADDAGEKWYLKAYNWSSSTYSDSGFNSTAGCTPTMAWDYYAVNLTDEWRSYIQDNGTIYIKFVDEGADSNQTTIDIDFLGVRAEIDGTSFTFKNDGALTSHLVSLWMINSTNHQRYDISVFVNSADTKTYLRADISLPTGQYTVKIVTERGNTAIYSGS